MSISTTTLNLSAWGLAALTATGLFMASPFTQDPPADLPAPPMEVRCASFDLPDPKAAPILTGCQYQGYPVAVIAPTPTPF